MKAKRACTAAAAEKTRLMQQQSQKLRAASSALGRGNRSLGKAPVRIWTREQAVELSRMVLGFARLSRRLPDAGDRAFWQLCHKRFQGVFTCKQMHAKVRYLHLRFRKLADGAAKTLHLAERHSVQIWTQILHHTNSSSPSTRQDQLPRSTSPASTRSRSSSPSPTKYRHSGDTHQADNAGGCEGAQFYAQYENVAGTAKSKGCEGNASTGTAFVKEAWCTNKACHRHVNGVTPNFQSGKSTGSTGNGATAAGEAEHAQEGSACSTQMHEDMTNEEGIDAEGVEAAAADATATAARKNAALLHHVTVADLAAAVKILAEVVACRPGLI